MTNLLQALQLAKRDRFNAQKSGDTSAARAQRTIAWLGGTTSVARVTEARLRALVLAMRASGLGPASVNRHLSALRVALKSAGQDSTAMPWQKEPRGRTRWLSPAEVNLLASACVIQPNGLAVGLLVRFLGETGLRVGEALALQWADVDLLQRPHVIVRTSKNGDSRWVPLTNEAVQVLRVQKDLSAPFRLSQSRVNHIFRAARDSMDWSRGNSEIVPHTLRHTAASRLVQAGVSLPVVQAWLGHRDFRSTLRYTHVDQDGLAAAARMLENRQ